MSSFQGIDYEAFMYDLEPSLERISGIGLVSCRYATSFPLGGSIPRELNMIFTLLSAGTLQGPD